MKSAFQLSIGFGLPTIRVLIKVPAMKAEIIAGCVALLLATGRAHAYPPRYYDCGKAFVKIQTGKGAAPSFQRHGLFKKIGKGKMRKICHSILPKPSGKDARWKRGRQPLAPTDR
jgi:hypothetical protein